MSSKKNKKKSSSRLDTIRASLLSQVDASILGAFRIIFGLALCYSTCKTLLFDMVKFHYIDPKFHFPYEWFPWIAPLPGSGMYFVYVVMAGAAFLLAIGLFYRWSAFVFTVLYTYVFLIDEVNYNNHYYLICLLGLLFTLTNADRWMSVDAWRKKNYPDTVPYWQLLIFKAQVFIVYFYGGIAKINWDWLGGEPMRHWILESAEDNVTPKIVSDLFRHELAAYFFSYGGLLQLIYRNWLDAIKPVYR
jgi:vitamin K-dependent gamma-carboxylase